MPCTRDIGAERQFRNVLGTYRVVFTLQYRFFTNVARRVFPLLQVFDGRSKTRNILPQQKSLKVVIVRCVIRDNFPRNVCCAESCCCELSRVTSSP